MPKTQTANTKTKKPIRRVTVAIDKKWSDTLIQELKETRAKLFDECLKAGRAQAALELLGLPDLSSKHFDAAVDAMQKQVNPFRHRG